MPNLMRAKKLAGADLMLHVVLGKQEADAIFQFVGDLSAAADDLGEIDCDPVDGDAVLLGIMANLVNERAIFQQRLGGNAAPVEARAAEVFFFDAEDAFFELPGANGGGIARGAAADDDNVPVIFHARLRWSRNGRGRGCGLLHDRHARRRLRRRRRG